MRIIRNEQGHGPIMLLLVLVVVAAIGYAGFRVWQAKQPAAPTNLSTTKGSTSSSTVPASIKNQADLNQASSALDASSTQLNTIQGSGLNTDISSML